MYVLTHSKDSGQLVFAVGLSLRDEKDSTVFGLVHESGMDLSS